MRFSELPVRLRILTMVQAAAALTAGVLTWETPSEGQWGALLFLAALGGLGGALKVDAQVRQGRITMGFMAAYFALLLIGTSAAVLVGLAAVLASALFTVTRRERRFEPRKALSCKAVYNISNVVLAACAMGWIYGRLGGSGGEIRIDTAAVPVLASAAGYYVVNALGVSLAVSWSQRIHPIEVFRKHFAWAGPGFLAGASIAAGLLWLVNLASFHTSVLLLLLPLAYLVYFSFAVRSEKMRADMEHVSELYRLNDAIIASLATAIDAKDRTTGKHVYRVREYATGLAERLGASADETQAIRIAALLHDVGKLGIPEHILGKPGKLTPEEFEVIKTHVQIGAAILEPVNFPWPVVPIVMAHHERWDGLGYPNGTRGDEIPLGGRIISLVDVFDALTSDRPYRRAMSTEEALGVLRAGSGTQFDPRVVDTFVALLPELEARFAALAAAVEEEGPEILATVAERVANVEAARAAEQSGPDREITVELADLLREEPVASRVGPLLSERVGALVPYSALALYILDDSKGTVFPVWVEGQWTELLDQMEIRSGEGLTGFVVATGEAQINAFAGLDLCRRVRPGQNLELSSAMSVPLFQGERVIGALTVYHTGYNFYQPIHLERLLRVAAQTAQVVEAIRLRQQDLPIPRQDASTSLPNGRVFLERLDRQIQTSRGAGEPFAILFVRAGGERCRGEELFQRLGSALQEIIRDGDCAARFSRDEFALILPRCAAADAGQISDRLRERVRWEQLVEALGPVSLSIGLAVFPADGDEGGQLLAAAAQRLSAGEHSLPAAEERLPSTPKGVD